MPPYNLNDLDDEVVVGVDSANLHGYPNAGLSISRRDMPSSSRTTGLERGPMVKREQTYQRGAGRSNIAQRGLASPLLSSSSTVASLETIDRGMMRASAPSFHCPLTMVLMKDPVQDREGNSYEKGAIEKWLTENDTSPITRNRLRRKHLVPNRALKEAIDFEAKHQKDPSNKNSESVPPPPPPPKQNHHQDAISNKHARSAPPAISSGKNATNHHQIINNFLASINVKSRLDHFGIAFLPMDKLQPTPNNDKILMVIEAPPTKGTFQLYTHFNCTNIKRLNSFSEEESLVAGSSSNENRVLNNLVQHGKHKALTLTKVCEERMRFAFEGRNSEIGSKKKLKGVLNMFVKVSFRMKKRVEA